MSHRRRGLLSETTAVSGFGELDLNLGNLGRPDIATTHGRDLFGTSDVGGTAPANVDRLRLEGTILLCQEDRARLRVRNSDNPNLAAVVFEPFVSEAHRAVCLGVDELLERRVVDVVGRWNAGRVCFATGCLLHADQDVSGFVPPGVGEG